MRPTLFIERFIVFRDKKDVYDQTFHKGVNIIRGSNSTGKSTVMDLLYYALGGEIKDWTKVQRLCTHVHVEVSLNGRVFCLRREITETGKAAMFVFEGKSEDALSDARNWLRYPNKRGDDKHSYSEQLFELMGLPQHKTETANNLTMHQILRLIYVDQLTDTTKLLNDEKEWDNAVTRKAIGEYLLSVDDLEAHKLRQKLIAANKRYESISGELSAITKILRREEQVFHVENLKADIRGARLEIEKLNSKKSEVQGQKLEKLNDDVRLRSDEIIKKIDALTDEQEELSKSKSVATAEKLDTSNFLRSVDERLSALEHSTITQETLGEIGFDYCPSCLSEIADELPEGHCRLCKSEHSSSSRKFAYLQMINELQFQARESRQLLPELESEIDQANRRLPEIDSEIGQLKSEYRNLTANADAAEALLYEIASEIGFHKGQIENLEEKLEFAEKIEGLRTSKEQANLELTRIKDALEAVEASQEERRLNTYSNIEKIAKSLIVADGGYEADFKEPDEISFDFAKNKMFVNGRSKFSASSMVIMKNSIRSAIFLNSITDPQMRYPRILLNDNIEDKGMTPERSHNFQENLVRMCDEQTEDYQLIFTTSMISSSLDKYEYVAGPNYPKGSHTLSISAKN